MIEADWRVAFIDYIQEHKLPPGIDPKSAEATRILRRSNGYVLVGGNLYKRGSASGILIKCVTRRRSKKYSKRFTGACAGTTQLLAH
jgi:hypothetical protein